MKPQCITAVSQHLGRELTEAEVNRIDQDMHAAAKVLQRRDRAKWDSWSADERITEMGKWSMEQKKGEAIADRNAKLSSQRGYVNALQKTGTFAAQLVDKNGKPKAGRHERGVIEFLRTVRAAERGAEHMAASRFANMLDAIKWKTPGDGPAAMPPFASRKLDDFFGDAMREIDGIQTGNADAQRFARAYTAEMESQRQLKNRNGGNIGKLENRYPQIHNRLVMQKRPAEWLEFWLKNADRDKYRHLTDDGSIPGDDKMRPFLEAAYKNIVTDGAISTKMVESGVPEMPRIAAEAGGGRGGSANLARSQNGLHRQLFLKDANAAIEYNAKFNDKSLGAIFHDDMLRGAGESAKINEMGANPGNTYEKLIATARAHDASEALQYGYKMDDGGVKGARKAGFNADAYFRNLMRDNDSANVFERISHASTAYQAMTKLTSTALRAPFQDTPGMMMLLADLKQWHNFVPTLQASLGLGAKNKKFLAQYAINAEQALNEMKEGAQRVTAMAGTGNAISNFLSRGAETTMKYTLLNRWTNVTRRWGQTARAFALGDWGQTAWRNLDEEQRAVLMNNGFDEQTWAHVNAFQPDALRGTKIHDLSKIEGMAHLSEDEKFTLYSRMAAFVREGGDITTSEHNFTAQTVMSGGGRSNALNQQMMLFKSAGSAQTAHLAERIQRKGGLLSRGGGKVIAMTFGLNYTFGYMALAAQAVLAGQKPPDPLDPRTIGNAVMLSGGFAMFGDMLRSIQDAASGDTSGHASGPIPMFNEVTTLSRIGYQYAFGDTEKANYAALKYARQQVPFLNYWYTKNALDHMFFNDAFESVNPGYQRRMRKYADAKGQQYFYDPAGNYTGFGFGEYQKPFLEK